MTRAANVLLVEDEMMISQMVADSLNERGFTVYEMASADDALRYIDAGGEVDLLFTDINLPGHMDGAELAERARQIRPELPIIYASGRIRACDIGLVPRSAFVAKPYDTDEVCTLIGRLTASNGP